MNLFSEVMQAVLEVTLPILVGALAAWVVAKCKVVFKELKDENPELYEILTAVSSTAVQAAEQVYGGEKGQEKKAYALNVAEKYLSAKGINLDLDIIDAYIESAVKERANWGLDEKTESETETVVVEEVPAVEVKSTKSTKKAEK
jgi:hypothetical protein